MIHSFVIGLTLSITSGSEFSECARVRPSQSSSERNTRVSFSCDGDHISSTIRGPVVGHTDSDTARKLPNPSTLDDDVVCDNSADRNRSWTHLVR